MSEKALETNSPNPSTSIHPVDEKLSFWKSFSLAVQHMLIAILAAIPVPLIIAQNCNLSNDDTIYFICTIILACGVSSILSSMGPKQVSPQIPMIMGASFSAIPICITTINAAESASVGFQLIAGGTLTAGIAIFILSSLWSKLKPLFPQVVVATNTMILGVYLIPNTFSWMLEGAKIPGQMPLNNFYLTLFVIVLNITLTKFLKGFLANLNVLICLIVGTIVAGFFDMVHLESVLQTKIIAPIIPFVRFGFPRFSLVTMTSFIIIGMLSMVEVSGTSMGLYNIVKKDMDDQELKKVLRISGINASISALLNSVHVVPFIQTLGLLDITKIFSRFTIALSGLLLIILSFFPISAQFINAIPKPVLGGVCLSIFGGIISSGASMLKNVEMEGNNNKMIVGISIGIALIPAFYRNFYAEFPQLVQDILGNGIVAGGLCAIFLNLIFNFKEVKQAYKR